MPRPLELVLAAVLAAVTWPIVALCALAVRVTSGRPAFFRSVRCGKDGEPFVMLKLRTMEAVPAGAAITKSSDDRITPIGRFLRHTKLDELPQLWNVLKGDMSLVGPRPEDPKFVDLDDTTWQTVLSVRPGMTGTAVLEHHDEEATLAASPDDVEVAYIRDILPLKLSLDEEYVQSRSAAVDAQIIGRTIALVFGRFRR